jgi:hypothetical protein
VVISFEFELFPHAEVAVLQGSDVVLGRARVARVTTSACDKLFDIAKFRINF